MFKHNKFLIIFCLVLFSQTAGAVPNDVEWKSVYQMKLPAKAAVLAYSSDGSRIAVGHHDGRVSIWSTKTGELIHLYNAHSKEVNSIQFIRQDKQLMTMGDDRFARFWSTTDWKEETVIADIAFAGGISPDATLLAAMDPKQAIWIWDLSTLKPIKQLSESGKGGAQTVTFLSDGKSVVSNIRPYLIDIASKEPFSFVTDMDKKTQVKIEPLGNNQAGISMGAFQDDDAIVHKIAVSRTGLLVALGRGWYGQPAFIDVWDMQSKKRIGRYKTKDGGTLSSFSFDNSLLAVEGSSKVTFWELAKSKPTGTVNADGIMQFSPVKMELAATNSEILSIYVQKEKN